MAKMCVEARRLDVSRLCLGKMGNGLGALQLRLACETESDTSIQAGHLALQLGMNDKAKQIFADAGRWDLVGRIYQALGQWDSALQVIEKHNRVRIRSAHYAFAKELEAEGKVDEAIEQSQTPIKEEQ
ncbi:unnamed protein product [Protopolystoma xenopodis]|uniref:IF140/IFT172/WDR19 TPR domain-containing protein n=1 Tax=Protopolystoma xenopodis TaxID=117903 RepID=A0A448WKR0_9PLAT|nr:unnamed protein product [Protopolystoma xenopodis]